jgi:hypothetical protein
MLALISAGVLNNAAGDFGRAAALVLGVDGALDETTHEAMFIGQMMGGNLVNRRQAAKGQPRCAPSRRCACLRCLACRDHDLVCSAVRVIRFPAID